ncbi:MAG: hypothetical protein L0Y56_12565 [Nitrospira sp.]|nr:hypothetical protein [Nitrospira sp.]
MNYSYYVNQICGRAQPGPIPRHRHGCAYGARRPSGLDRHSIEAMDVAAFDTAVSPAPAVPCLKLGGEPT